MNEITFWNDKKVLVTGHTGFKGSWLCVFLYYLGAKVYGLSKEVKEGIYTDAKISKLLESEIYFDISTNDNKALENLIKKIKPDIVFHFAAQSLVIKSYEDPKETIYSNIIGSYNVIDSIAKSNEVKSLIIATTDKVYKYPDKKNTELSELGGKDFYSASKVSVELIISAYLNNLNENELNLSVVRSGNVIGGGDRSENRLINDLIKAIVSKNEFKLRMPHSVRPWQYILDSLHGYLLVAKENYEDNTSQIYNLNSEINNKYDSQTISSLLIKAWGSDIKIEINNKKKYQEVEKLVIDSKKAYDNLGWKPKYSIEDAIAEIVGWEKHHLSDSSPEFSLNEVGKFLSI